MRLRPALVGCAILLAPVVARGDESAPCRVTGGGCLNLYQPGHHIQATFGGNVGSLHGSWQGYQGTPIHNWEHVFRDGRTILFNFHSADAHVVRCRPEPPESCPPPGAATRVEFEGTGKFSIG